MKKIPRSLAVLAVLISLAACLEPQITQRELHRQLALARAQSEQELTALKAELERLRTATSEHERYSALAANLQAELDRLRSSYTDLEAQKSNMAEEVARLEALRDEAARLSTEAEAARRRAESIERERDEIRQELGRFIDLGGIGVDVTPDGVMITMRESILFDSGKADLKPSSSELLAKLAEVLGRTHAREIRIAGHTDNKPIRTPQFPSNWELSTARALSVLHRLVDDHRLPAEKLVAVGFGENRPVASNDTNEGRAKNRRVEIFLVPER